MWRGFASLGCVVLAFSSVIAASGCGQISGATPDVSEGGVGGGDGASMQAGNRASENGGAGGSANEAGAPSDGGSGQDELAGAGGAAAEGTEAGEGCSLVHHVEVPFPITPEWFVVKSGPEFAVSDGQTFAAVSWSGQLARQSFDRDTCQTCQGTLALTALRAAAGWRLLSIDSSGPGGGPGSRAWRMDDASPPKALTLFGPEYSVFGSTVAIGRSRDGTRAVFANGNQLAAQEMRFAVLDTDGQMLAPPIALAIPSPHWDNLTIVSTEDAAAISLIAESDDPELKIWLLRELNSSGQIVFASEVSLPAGNGRPLDEYGGKVIVEDAEGYFLGLRNALGAPRVGRLRRDRPNELVVDESLIVPGVFGPGNLVGTLAGMLVFLQQESTATTAQSRFVGVPKSGGGETRTLAVTPALDLYPNPRVRLIAIEGNSLFYEFKTGDHLVIEEVTCSTE